MEYDVFLSAGHGGNEPGAVAYGVQEKVVNLVMMLACRDVLVRHGLSVLCSRLKDENDNVYEEVKEANKSGCKIALSFHNNAGEGDGFEVFYYPTSVNGKKLALLCEKHIKAIGQNSRGIKTNKLYFTRETKMTAVLCEGFFMDNSKDRVIADTLEEQKAFGEAYAKAVLEYFGIDYKESTADQKWFKVQVGAFKDEKNAKKLLKELESKGYEPIIVEV